MKSGIDYFPLDVNLDEKWELIEAEFGLTGFGVVVKILQKIYGGQGYYIEWTNEVALLFAKRIGLGGSAVSEIVSASIKRGIFDKELYEKYNILTSVGVQKRYFEAVSRRKNLEVESAYLLVDIAQYCKNVDIKRKNAGNKGGNANISQQSKVEDSKVEKSKVENEKQTIKHKYGEFNNVLLTDEEYAKLKELFTDIQERIENLSIYIESKGAKYKSHYATILTWARNDNKQKGTQNQTAPQKKQTGFNNFEGRNTSYQDIEDDYFEMVKELSNNG